MVVNTVKDMTTNFGKLDKFEGHDFKRWHKKMHFLLTTLKVVYVLTTPMPKLLEDDRVEAIRRREKWENGDYICRGHILNGMADPLFDIYQNVESAKELWDSLESKHIAEDASKESLRAQESKKGKGKEVVGPSVNMTEEGGKNKNNKQNKGKKRSFKENNGSFGSNKKPKLECWKCGKTGHFKRDCRSGNKKNNASASGSGKGSKDQSQDQGQNLVHVWNRFVKYSVSLSFESFYVQVDAIAWWINSGATTHVCKDRCWFKTYEPMEDGSVLYMGDDHFAPVYESDKYILSKSGVFVRLGYCNNGMFMLNLNKISDDSGSVYMPSSTVVNSLIWHARLRHVHYKINLEMSKDDLIPAIDENPENVLLAKRKTLGEKGIDSIFVGYAEHSKTYRFYVIEPNDSVSINSIIESRDVILNENRFSSIPRPKDIIPNSDESQRDDHSNDVPSETPEPCRGKRARKAKSYGSDFQLYLVEGSRDQIGSQYFYCYSIEEDHKTYNEAMQSRDAAFFFGKKQLMIRLVRLWKIIHGSCLIYLEIVVSFSSFPQSSDPSNGCQNNIFNGDLEEEVYTKQSEGFVMPSDEHKVCKLVKVLYGLEQAPKFSMKDMGEADVILGIKIKRENKGIVITQSHYIEKILKKFNREDCSPVSTPMDLVEKLKPNTGKPVDQLEYSRAIGCLMYAMTSTRPDIAYAVGRLSRFTSNPSRQHWHAITRVFKYLKGTMNYGLSYVGYPSVLEAYSDASWINHVEDSSSTSGWVFLLGGGAISWASKKQTCITGSTMESEFVALAAVSKEAEWLRNLIHEIPIWPKPIASIFIHCDSAATLAKAYSQIYNGKSRHLGVRHSMIRELIMNGVISIKFVQSQHNLADHLMKGLARDLVVKLVIGMGLKSI
ncbi:zinc finger, CCHC-type containing protein [Tanacetum coccineum]